TVKRAAADVNCSIRAALAERNAVCAGVGVRIAQQKNCAAREVESAPSIAVPAATKAKPAIIDERAAIDRERADPAGPDFEATQAGHRAAIQCEKARPPAGGANLKDIPIVCLARCISLDA